MNGRRLVFIGPTPPPALRPRIGVEYLPPIRHGGLTALDLGPGDQVLVVDGVYQHYAPIRHKEIMAQIDRGVSVAGAASLGALRAAELADFGMRGIGAVFELARAGELVSDADVAVLNAPDEDESRRLTVALVSVTQAARELEATGALEVLEARAVERVARSLHFTERSEQALRHAAEQSHASAAMARVLAAISGAGDVKARDALTAIHELAQGFPAPERPAEPAAQPAAGPAAWQSSYGLEWQFAGRPLLPGSPVRARDALAWLQLFAPDYPERHRAYAYRVAAESTGGRNVVEFLASAGFGRIEPTRPLARPTAATASWTVQERVFTRTFRLRPGRLIYLDLPAEALAGQDLESVERRCLDSRVPHDPADQPARRWRPLLQEAWNAADAQRFRLCALERGFRDEAEALRFAAGFRLPVGDRVPEFAA